MSLCQYIREQLFPFIVRPPIPYQNIGWFNLSSNNPKHHERRLENDPSEQPWLQITPDPNSKFAQQIESFFKTNIVDLPLKNVFSVGKTTAGPIILLEFLIALVVLGGGIWGLSVYNFIYLTPIWLYGGINFLIIFMELIFIWYRKYFDLYHIVPNELLARKRLRRMYKAQMSERFRGLEVRDEGQGKDVDGTFSGKDSSLKGIKSDKAKQDDLLNISLRAIKPPQEKIDDIKISQASELKFYPNGTPIKPEPSQKVIFQRAVRVLDRWTVGIMPGNFLISIIVDDLVPQSFFNTSPLKNILARRAQTNDNNIDYGWTLLNNKSKDECGPNGSANISNTKSKKVMKKPLSVIPEMSVEQFEDRSYFSKQVSDSRIFESWISHINSKDAIGDPSLELDALDSRSFKNLLDDNIHKEVLENESDELKSFESPYFKKRSLENDKNNLSRENLPSLQVIKPDNGVLSKYLSEGNADKKPDLSDESSSHSSNKSSKKSKKLSRVQFDDNMFNDVNENIENEKKENIDKFLDKKVGVNVLKTKEDSMNKINLFGEINQVNYNAWNSQNKLLNQIECWKNSEDTSNSNNEAKKEPEMEELQFRNKEIISSPAFEESYIYSSNNNRSPPQIKQRSQWRNFKLSRDARILERMAKIEEWLSKSDAEVKDYCVIFKNSEKPEEPEKKGI